VHRSRLSVLVIFAAAAACSKHDGSEGNAILSEDRTLVARLDVDQETHKPALPAACGTIAIPAQPAVTNQRQAEELTRQASDAEMHGDVKQARSLLRRASELDATNKTAAYHLGRTSETLGDRTAAMTAYCRYLALTPTTAEAVEAHQRVTKLAQSKARVAAASVIDSNTTAQRTPAAPARSMTPVTHVQPTVARRVAARTPAVRQSATSSSARERTARVPSAGAGSVAEAPAPRDPPATTAQAGDTTTSTVTGGDVVMAQNPEPSVEQPAPPPRTSRRSPSRAQSAGIGAAAGAIIGGVTGRSVKSAVIGAAAGGILGTVVGGGMHPVARSITPWASGT
jgi:hypothetical protein